MREIKYRGKRLDNGEWVYGYLYEQSEKTHIIVVEGVQLKPNDVNGPAEYDEAPNFYEVNPGSVGQYTGLRGMKAVPGVTGEKLEVYDGDIRYVIVACAHGLCPPPGRLF